VEGDVDGVSEHESGNRAESSSEVTVPGASNMRLKTGSLVDDVDRDSYERLVLWFYLVHNRDQESHVNASD